MAPIRALTGKCAVFVQRNITMQLYPFFPTPNRAENIRQYKAWMSKVGDYDVTETKGLFGFIPSKSKTDNFKVASYLETLTAMEFLMLTTVALWIPIPAALKDSPCLEA